MNSSLWQLHNHHLGSQVILSFYLTNGIHWAKVKTHCQTYEHDQEKRSISTSAMMYSLDGGFYFWFGAILFLKEQGLSYCIPQERDKRHKQAELISMWQFCSSQKANKYTEM